MIIVMNNIILDLDACLTNPCPANSTCADTPTSYTCTCDDGFTPNNTGNYLNTTKIAHGLW